MIRIDSNIINDHANEIRLFSVIRNEAIRLPFFLEYYRKMGVERFFFVDNNSTDDTVTFLLAQKDVHIFSTKQKFVFKEYWLQELLDDYGIGYWCVAVDADEFIIYPYCEKITLRDFCNCLEKRGEDAIENLLVDMYSEKEFKKIRYNVGENLFDVFSYFDEYSYRRILDKRRNRLIMQTIETWTYFGGTRERAFNCPKICCSKYSLFKHNTNMCLDAGMHGIVGAQISEVQGVTLHFKYLKNFEEYVKQEVIRAEHFGLAKEYQQYQEAMQNYKIDKLYYDKSQKYKDSLQMLQLGFMKAPETFLDECLNFTIKQE